MKSKEKNQARERDTKIEKDREPDRDRSRLKEGRKGESRGKEMMVVRAIERGRNRRKEKVRV